MSSEIVRCVGCSLSDGRHAEDCPLVLEPGVIPRVVYLPRNAMLEGFQKLGGLRFFIRGILRTYGAAKQDVELVTTAVDAAVEEKEPIELSIVVGRRGRWTMVLA